MYFEMYYFIKKCLKAISKVHVYLNELQVKFNMQSLKRWFSHYLQKIMFYGQKSEIR